VRERPVQTVVLVTAHIVVHDKADRRLDGAPRFDALQSLPPGQSLPPRTAPESK
jgi:hypothetical protein